MATWLEICSGRVSMCMYVRGREANFTAFASQTFFLKVKRVDWCFSFGASNTQSTIIVLVGHMYTLIGDQWWWQAADIETPVNPMWLFIYFFVFGSFPLPP